MMITPTELPKDLKLGTLLKFKDQPEDFFTLQYLGSGNQEGCFLGKVIKSNDKFTCYPIGMLNDNWLSFLYEPIEKEKAIIEHISQFEALKEVEQTFKEYNKNYTIEYSKHINKNHWTIMLWNELKLEGLATIIDEDDKFLLRIDFI